MHQKSDQKLCIRQRIVLHANLTKWVEYETRRLSNDLLQQLQPIPSTVYVSACKFLSTLNEKMLENVNTHSDANHCTGSSYQARTQKTGAPLLCC